MHKGRPPTYLQTLTYSLTDGLTRTVYLRTMALITYLAHVGSFVPAEAATLGLTISLSLTLGLGLWPMAPTLASPSPGLGL